MSNEREEVIELYQKRLRENIDLFKQVIDTKEPLKIIEVLYINQMWIMQALNIILEDMKK